MERINVSKEFRLAQTNSNFTMKFSSEVDLEKAYKAMESAINEIDEDNDYKRLWLQDLRDCLTEKQFDIESTLSSEQFAKYIPAMCKAVAKEISFSGSATYDDVKCYYIHHFDYTFSNGVLYINEELNEDEILSVDSYRIKIEELQ